MSLYLYATAFPEPLPDAQFRSLLDLIPITFHEGIGKYRRWQDAHAALLGKILLRIALEKAGHLSDLSRLQYTQWKKPFLPAGPEFNISHSGNRVVCILGTSARIGIDIEILKPFSFDGFELQFTPAEWAAIHTAPSPMAAFFHFWTAKESLIKADGRGLDIPLQELDLTKPNPIRLNGSRWSIHNLPLFDDYACHMAIEDAPPDTLPPAIELHDLIPADFLATFTINQLRSWQEGD
jgi:4'-phosphopantetheinyl transferase